MKLEKHLRLLLKDLEDYEAADADYQATLNLDCIEGGGFVPYVVYVALRDARRQGIECDLPKMVTITDALNIVAGLIKKAKGEVEGKPQHDGPYTVSEAARLLGFSTRHTYNLRKEGKIASYGPPYRITKEAIEAFKRESKRVKQYRHL